MLSLMIHAKALILIRTIMCPLADILAHWVPRII